jgi:hypothetical protein
MKGKKEKAKEKEKEKEQETIWEIPVAYAFCSTFREVLGFSMEIEEFEAHIADGYSNTFEDFMKKLLLYATNKKSFREGPASWQKALKNFFKLSPLQKAQIIKVLCDHILMENHEVKDFIEEVMKNTEDEQNEFLLLEPYGVDSKGNRYWHFGESSCWIYKEAKNRGTWKLVSKSLDDLEILAISLSGSSKEEKALREKIVNDLIPLINANILRKEKAQRLRDRQQIDANQILQTATRKRATPARYNFDYLDDELEEQLKVFERESRRTKSDSRSSSVGPPLEPSRFSPRKRRKDAEGFFVSVSPSSSRNGSYPSSPAKSIQENGNGNRNGNWNEDEDEEIDID